MLRLTSKVFCGLAVVASSAWCQTTTASLPGFFDRFSVCDSGAETVAPGQLDFKQQTCWYANQLAAPSMFLHAGFSAAMGQWHNDIYGWGREGSDYAHRFGVFYARHGARDAAELLAGYLNHEDPRPRASGETGIMRRTKAALESVVVARTDEGNRVAVSPIAGALGSAVAGSALCREHSFTGGTFAKEASFGYSAAFATAVYREFKPDLAALARHALQKAENYRHHEPG